MHLARGKEERETSSRFMEGPIPEPKQTIVYPLFINQYFNENEFAVRKVRDWAILKQKECCMMNETFDNFKTN